MMEDLKIKELKHFYNTISPLKKAKLSIKERAVLEALFNGDFFVSDRPTIEDFLAVFKDNLSKYANIKTLKDYKNTIKNIKTLKLKEQATTNGSFYFFTTFFQIIFFFTFKKKICVSYSLLALLF